MKKLYGSLVLLLISYCSYSQLYDSKYLKASVGYEKNGYIGNISYINHIGTDRFFEFGAEMEIEKYKFENQNIPVQLAIFNTSYYHQIFSFSLEDRTVLYLGGGVLGGYEWINNDKKNLPNNQELLINSKFIYGLTGGFFLKIRLFDVGRHVDNTVSLILETKYNYFINSQVGTIQPNIKLGFMISI